MAQQLRVVDSERIHTRDIAKRAVKEFRLDRDNTERPLSVSNQVDSGAPLLFVDETIRRTEREMPEEVRPRYKVNPELLIKVFILLSLGVLGVKALTYFF